MPKDNGSNDYFKHLEQPAAAPQQRKLRAPNEATKPVSPTARPTDKTRGPGLSPGMPVLEKPAVGGGTTRPASGVVLTPGGVMRTDENPAPPPPPPIPEEETEDALAESRSKNEEEHVGWEEYAATDFPALPAEDLGVKTKKTDSGRVVPVAVRADLTDEALKGKSIKDKGGAGKAGRAPKPGKPPARKADAPRSWMGKIGHSLRMKLLGGKVVEEDEEIDEWTEQQLDDETKGFARSGSLKDKKSKRKASPATMVKNLFVEIVKLVMLVLLLRAYVLQVSEVNGPSMEPSLKGGAEDPQGGNGPADRLVVERVTAHLANLDPRWTNWMPEFMHPRFQRGDIIVVRSPENPGSELVKRLIALPGDVIKLDKGKLWIKYDGQGDFKEIDEPYLGEQDGKPRKSYDSGSLPEVLEEGRELTVPDQRIFVMGDNRSHSNDSRKWLDIEVGKSEAKYGGAAQNLSGHNKLWLHMSSIEGRVLFRIYPFDRMGKP